MKRIALAALFCLGLTSVAKADPATVACVTSLAHTTPLPGTTVHIREQSVLVDPGDGPEKLCEKAAAQEEPLHLRDAQIQNLKQQLQAVTIKRDELQRSKDEMDIFKQHPYLGWIGAGLGLLFVTWTTSAAVERWRGNNNQFLKGR